jgi:hypothetical protein
LNGRHEFLVDDSGQNHQSDVARLRIGNSKALHKLGFLSKPLQSSGQQSPPAVHYDHAVPLLCKLGYCAGTLAQN